MTPAVTIVLPILIREPWQKMMTESCIKIMQSTTQVPYELIVVETQSRELDPTEHGPTSGNGAWWNYRYIHRPERTSLVADLNAGIDAASGDYIGWIGNDIITKPGWLEALLDCFTRYQDCGIASLAAQEVGAALNHQPGDFIIEGWYGPLVLFKKGWRLDEAAGILCESDLIMQLYHAGLRAYRNHKVVILHLYQQTFANESGWNDERAQRETRQRFMERWGSSPLWAASMILRGGVIFGKEYDR